MEKPSKYGLYGLPANLEIPPQPWGFLDEFGMLNYISIYFTSF